MVISDDDYVLEINGGNGSSLTVKTLSGIAGSTVYNLGLTGANNGSSSMSNFNYNLKIPAGVIPDGEYNVIVPAAQFGTIQYNKFRSKSGASTKIQISSTKYVLENTAWVNKEKSSKVGLLVNTAPRLNIFAFQNGVSLSVGSTTFKGSNFPSIDLKSTDQNSIDVTNDQQVRIEYKIYIDDSPAAFETVTLTPSSSKSVNFKNYFTDGVVKVKIEAQAICTSDKWSPSVVKDWTFIRDLKRVKIVPDNYDLESLKDTAGLITFDTKEFGGAGSKLGIPENGNVKFKIMDGSNEITIDNNKVKVQYSLDGGYTFHTYNVSTGIKIDIDWAELKVILLPDGDYIADAVEFTFYREMEKPIVDLFVFMPQRKSAAHPVQYCGDTQTVQIDYEEGSTLQYLYSADVPIKEDDIIRFGITTNAMLPQFKIHEGGPYNSYEGADTFYVGVSVSDGVNNPIFKIWKLVPHCLPEVKVTPEGNPYKFKDSVQIKVSVSPEDSKDNISEWGNTKIYYTTDGTEPEPANKNAKFITGREGSIWVKATETYKFAAFAEYRTPSSRCNSPTPKKYQRVASVIKGWYYDTQGKGNITKVAFYMKRS